MTPERYNALSDIGIFPTGIKDQRVYYQHPGTKEDLNKKRKADEVVATEFDTSNDLAAHPNVSEKDDIQGSKGEFVERFAKHARSNSSNWHQNNAFDRSDAGGSSRGLL